MTDEQFERLMKKLGHIELQLMKISLGLGVTMSESQRNGYSDAIRALLTEWSKDNND